MATLSRWQTSMEFPLIINIVLALVAALLLFGVIGEKDGLRQQNITIAFVAVIVLIISLNRFF